MVGRVAGDVFRSRSPVIGETGNGAADTNRTVFDGFVRTEAVPTRLATVDGDRCEGIRDD